MDAALELGDYLPVSYRTRSEEEYIDFLWEAFQSNYANGKYEFSSLAFHLLYMSFVSFSIWQVRLAREADFKKALIGFLSDAENKLLEADSPFKFFENLKESQIFRFLKLIGCENDQVGEFAKFVRRRNKIAHPSGTVFFNDQVSIDGEITDMMREVANIQRHMRPIILEVYGHFLMESSDIDTREYTDPNQEVEVSLIHRNYISQKDIDVCLPYDLSQHASHPIKEALQQVHAGTALDPSPRDLQLEKDTLNVPGSPPITETILRKIDACAVFVADLTIVGQSLAGLSDNGPGKLFPNSNVVMEYGYALKSRGHSRLVAVTNEAFGGEVQESSLPFNLRHRRWPIRYRFGPDTSPGDKKVVRTQLVKDLAYFIGLILREPRTADVAVPFIGSNFLPEAFVQMAKSHELLIDGPFGEGIPPYEIPGRGIITLRLQPTVQTPEFESEIDAKDAAWQGHLLPMAGYMTTGRSPARNAAGGIVYSAPTEGKLYHLSQLFLTKEIYGLDAQSSGANIWRNVQEEHPFFNVDAVEESFAITTRDYIRFAKDKLALPPPWRVQAAVFGVKNLRLQAGTQSLKNEIHWGADIAPDIAVLDLLDPFFNLLWKSFGVRRPQNSQQRLRQMFADLGVGK